MHIILSQFHSLRARFPKCQGDYNYVAGGNNRNFRVGSIVIIKDYLRCAVDCPQISKDSDVSYYHLSFNQGLYHGTTQLQLLKQA